MSHLVELKKNGPAFARQAVLAATDPSADETPGEGGVATVIKSPSWRLVKSCFLLQGERMSLNTRRITKKLNPAVTLEELETQIVWVDEDYSHWDCGITHDPESTLLQVGLSGGNWKCLDAGTEIDARWIETLLRSKGCHVLRHLGGDDAYYAFVYRNTSRATH